MKRTDWTELVVLFAMLLMAVAGYLLGHDRPDLSPPKRVEHIFARNDTLFVSPVSGATYFVPPEWCQARSADARSAKKPTLTR